MLSLIRLVLPATSTTSASKASTYSNMGGNNGHDKTTSPPSLATPTSHPGKPINPGVPDSDRSAGTSANEDEINVISGPSTPPTRSPAHFVLGNFSLAMALIFLIIFTIFFVVTWFTAVQDARSIMNDRAFINATGVSLFIPRRLDVADDCSRDRSRYSAIAFS